MSEPMQTLDQHEAQLVAMKDSPQPMDAVADCLLAIKHQLENLNSRVAKLEADDGNL